MRAVRAEVRELATLRQDGAVFVAHDAELQMHIPRPIARFGGLSRHHRLPAPNDYDNR